METTYKYQEKCTLLVMSSDNYECAWKPYFELIKRNWINRPQNIVLCTESKTFQADGIDIQVFAGGVENTWSKRLFDSLNTIDTEYVLFSLEDFFLLKSVDERQIERCLDWMENDQNIAEVRLKPSSDRRLIASEKYHPFKYAKSDTPYRLDTQAALWRKQDLLSFIDMTEDPWHFESDGTKRIIGSEKDFLWFFLNDEENEDDMIFPYHINQKYGYGIAWGRWLWNNKKLFRKYAIKGVDFRTFGVLSKSAVNLRFKYLYRTGKGEPQGFEIILFRAYKMIDRIQKAFIQIRLHGMKTGIKIAMGRLKQ